MNDLPTSKVHCHAIGPVANQTHVLKPFVDALGPYGWQNTNNDTDIVLPSQGISIETALLYKITRGTRIDVNQWPQIR